ncbi:MAG TPA: hypothetical protein VMV05_09100 [bacterium]|nr:hypothetical protein [bacterium]
MFETIHNSKFMIQNSIWPIVVAVLLIGQTAQADQQGGQRQAVYLEMGAGGAANAMGGAAVGMRGDVSCGYWNPAGLIGIRGFQIETQRSFLSMGQELDYLSLAGTFKDEYSLGLSGILYSAGGDLEARQGPSLAPDKLFDDLEMTLFPSVAARLSPRWSFGGSFKLFLENLGSFSGLGFGEDLGIQYRFTNDTTFGFMAQDPYSLISYSNNDNSLFPVTLKAGVAHHDAKLNAKMHFDLEWSNDLGFRPRLGLEWAPAKVIVLRGGCWLGNLTSGAPGGTLTLNPTAGIGLMAFLGDSLVEFDYTLLPDRIVSGGLTHQIAITGKFL